MTQIHKAASTGLARCEQALSLDPRLADAWRHRARLLEARARAAPEDSAAPAWSTDAGEAMAEARRLDPWTTDALSTVGSEGSIQ